MSHSCRNWSSRPWNGSITSTIWDSGWIETPPVFHEICTKLSIAGAGLIIPDKSQVPSGIGGKKNVQNRWIVSVICTSLLKVQHGSPEIQRVSGCLINYDIAGKYHKAASNHCRARERDGEEHRADGLFQLFEALEYKPLPPSADPMAD